MDFSLSHLMSKANSHKSSHNKSKANLTDNIQKFKAKKEAETAKKARDDADKKQNLLALRAQNKKSQKAANAMLKLTKSANKSGHKETTATLAGRYQPDEDDYGYESSVANSIYDKLMKKYEANPEDPMDKFKRPKTSVQTSKTSSHDPKFQPYRRPGSGSASECKKIESNSAGSSKTSGGKNCKKSTATSQSNGKTAAPPPSFAELLKMAEQKKKEPLQISSKPKEVKEAEFDRPMTAKEKEEYIRERNSQLRKEGKLPRISDSKSKPVVEAAKAGPSSVVKSTTPKGPCKENNFKQPSQKSGVKRDIHSVESRPFPGEIKVKRPRKERSPSPIGMSSSSRSSNKKSSKFNRIESDEEEYDSEMDDFIDDSDCKMDISAEISKIFRGYDRRNYRNEADFDDRSMENNRFSDIMREEIRSARIGRMEDEEDMRREEEEKRRKLMKKSKRR